MAKGRKRSPGVRAGDVFSCEAKRGRRYLVVVQVRRTADWPYAICREVSRSGRPVRGTDSIGADRRLPFDVRLRAGTLPPNYQEEER